MDTNQSERTWNCLESINDGVGFVKVASFPDLNHWPPLA